jgi:hypothetical protein
MSYFLLNTLHRQIEIAAAAGEELREGEVKEYFRVVLGCARAAKDWTENPLVYAIPLLARYEASTGSMWFRAYAASPEFGDLFRVPDGTLTVPTNGKEVDDYLLRTRWNMNSPCSCADLCARFGLLKHLVRKAMHLQKRGMFNDSLLRYLCIWSTRPIYGDSALEVLDTLVLLQGFVQHVNLEEEPLHDLLRVPIFYPPSAARCLVFRHYYKRRGQVSTGFRMAYGLWLVDAVGCGAARWNTKAIGDLQRLIREVPGMAVTIYSSLHPIPLSSHSSLLYTTSYVKLIVDTLETAIAVRRATGQADDPIRLGRYEESILKTLEDGEACYLQTMRLRTLAIRWIDDGPRGIGDKFRLAVFLRDPHLVSVTLRFAATVIRLSGLTESTRRWNELITTLGAEFVGEITYDTHNPTELGNYLSLSNAQTVSGSFLDRLEGSSDLSHCSIPAHLIVEVSGPDREVLTVTAKVIRQFIRIASARFAFTFRCSPVNAGLMRFVAPPDDSPPPEETRDVGPIQGIPLMKVREFLSRFPIKFQPLELSRSESHLLDAPLANLLRIGLNPVLLGPAGRCRVEPHGDRFIRTCILERAYLDTIRLSDGSMSHVLTTQPMYGGGRFNGDWGAKLSFSPDVTDQTRGRYSVQATSKQMLCLLSNPLIGMFCEAYDPIRTAPGLFSLEVRAIATMMLWVKGSERADTWRRIFQSTPLTEPCSIHAEAAEQICRIFTEEENGELVLSHHTVPASRRSTLMWLGKQMAGIAMHGCGLRHGNIPLAKSITQTKLFQDAFISESHDMGQLGLVGFDEIGIIGVATQPWYPGVLP